MNEDKKYNKLHNLGNYTKGAVKSFENNIVTQTDYLEKVNKELDNKNKE